MGAARLRRVVERATRIRYDPTTLTEALGNLPARFVTATAMGYGAGVKDVAVVTAMLLSFATWVTTHLLIVLRLMWKRRPRYRGLLALVVVPLAPVWAHEQGWRRSCWIWVGAVVGYALARTFAML